MDKDKPIWLSGFYKPIIKNWESWKQDWMMQEDDEYCIWLDGYFSEFQARQVLKYYQNRDDEQKVKFYKPLLKESK